MNFRLSNRQDRWKIKAFLRQLPYEVTSLEDLRGVFMQDHPRVQAKKEEQVGYFDALMQRADALFT
jgi:hypothetical protein